MKAVMVPVQLKKNISDYTTWLVVYAISNHKSQISYNTCIPALI